MDLNDKRKEKGNKESELDEISTCRKFRQVRKGL